jgi:hypothetical protein
MYNMRFIPFILLLCSAVFSYAQTTLEFPVEFKKNKVVTTLEIPRVASNFITLSAYSYSKKDMILSYRRKSDGKWSSWEYLRPAHNTEGQDRRAFEGEFIYSSPDSIQLRNDINESLNVTFRIYIALQDRPSIRESFATNSASCACPQPLICKRSCWCPDGSCPKDNTPTPTTVTHLIIHHSAGGGSAPDFAQVVESYWDLHVNTNGWDDIGYNWLIDPNGVVYEGRGSGVQGAHFSCMNQNTTGICMVGNFNNQSPSDTAMASLKQLLAWESCDKNILLSDSSYHASSQLLLPHVSTHRDGNASNAPNSCAVGTVCPGDSLYADFRLKSVMPATALICTQGVGLAEESINTSLRIYPNPVSDVIRLKFDETFIQNAPYRFSILDASGKLIKEQRGTALPSLLEVNVKTLEQGAYLLELRQEERLSTGRFIKH